MKHIGLNLVIGLALLAFLLPFQNCSVYQSKDRDDFENTGSAHARGAQLTSLDHKLMDLGQPANHSCNDIVNQETVRGVLGSQTIFTGFHNTKSNLLTCRITPLELDPSSVIHYNCQIIKDQAHGPVQLDGEESTWEHINGMQIGQATTTRAMITILDFYATKDDQPEMAHCQVSFTDLAHFEQHQQKVRNLGLQLVQHLTEQI